MSGRDPRAANVRTTSKREDGKPLIFAGLWERWQGNEGEEPLYTFTIVTTTANKEMSEFHHRMPVILDDEGQERWMDRMDVDTEALLALLKPMADGSLSVARVGSYVNKASNEGPLCVEPLKQDKELFEQDSE